MVEGSCVQNLWPFLYSTLVKTLKNWMCYKIKSLDSFSLKFWRNSHNDDTKMLKIWNFQKFQISTPPPRNPNFPNFGPKFPDRYLLVYFQIIYFLKALCTFHRYQNHNYRYLVSDIFTLSLTKFQTKLA